MANNSLNRKIIQGHSTYPIKQIRTLQKSTSFNKNCRKNSSNSWRQRRYL